MTSQLRPIFKLSAALLCAAATATFAQTATKPAVLAASDMVPLQKGWALQSGCKIQATGDAISTTAFHATGWTPATVPTTVLAAQVAAGEVKDPDYGTNLRSAPGMTTKTPPAQAERRGANAADGAAAGPRQQGPVANADGSFPTYAVGGNYANMPTPADSPYHCGWWYRTAFTIPTVDKGKTLWLRIGGINYRANVWLNGQKIADSNQIQGAFRTFDLNITSAAQPGKENVVAFETFGPNENDLTISWADWSPEPPDKEMGLWEYVGYAATGPVEVKDPAVTTHFPDDSLKQADLTVYGSLRNGTDKPVHGTLVATLAGIRLEQSVDLGPNEERAISFTPDQFPKLHVQNPTVWWPWQMGKPNLETLTLRFTANGQASDEISTRFGIREITDELISDKTQGNNIVPATSADMRAAAPEPPQTPQPQTPRPPQQPGQPGQAAANRPARPQAPPPNPQKVYRLYKVNGKPILIRGGGWAPDMMLRNQPDKLKQEFRMVRDMGLNTIRSEGKMETEDFFHLADEQGMLVMIGWTCCDRYERWRNWTPENQDVAVASLHSQILRLRSHPSVLVWLNGSDNPPTSAIEPLYLKEEADLHWPNPTLSSATNKVTGVSGESGVKMNGPYDIIAPNYWVQDDPNRRYGGAWGFATEIGPGPAIPTNDYMKKFLPEGDIWPHTDTWRYHAGGGGFRDVTKFDLTMKNTYGEATSSEDYNRVAQAIAYDGERAMFEAYTRNKYTSTGVIQWMLNNSWPSVIWHLYDYYLGTGGGYFGTKKADEPLHIQYSYDDHSIWVVNSTYTTGPELIAEANVYDNKLNQVFNKRVTVMPAPDSSARVIPIDNAVFNSAAPVYFVELQLRNKAGDVVSRNFYWVPSKPTTYDWTHTNYTGTLPLTYEDMTALRALPKADIEATAHVVNGRAEVHLHNPSKSLAFQVAVSTDPISKGVEAFPVLWSDNYVELMPGESITLSAQLAPGQTNPAIHVSGWNIASQTLHPAAAAPAAEKAAAAKGGQ